MQATELMQSEDQRSEGNPSEDDSGQNHYMNGIASDDFEWSS